MINTFQIVPFSPTYQPGIDAMRAAVSLEYTLPFFHQSSPKMETLYQLPGYRYWVALAGEQVVGTAGIIIAGDIAILKSFFVAKEYRGAQVGVARALLLVATECAEQAGCCKMYLGTMEQFVAAQRFYEKHGFDRVDTKDVPGAFPHNDFDVIFFKKSLLHK